MPRTNDNWVFSRGIAVSAQRVFFTSFPDTGDEEPREVTQVVCWSPSRVTSFMLPWEARGISYQEYPGPHGIVMGPFGQIRVSAPQGNTDESVALDDRGPSGLGVLRDLRAIGQHAYAVGMNRQCYRRTCGADPLTDGAWERQDSGVVSFGPPDTIVGFNSIDGFAEDDIYAVGWRGETWHYDGKAWKQAESVTNLKLERVVCGSQGTVFAVGQAGVIIRGARAGWAQIEQHKTNEQFWGATWYRGRLWISTLTNLYVLNEDDSLESVSLPLEEPLTCGWLMTAEGVLWSVGSHHIFSSVDGQYWTQLFL